jgi:MFS family permease
VLRRLLSHKATPPHPTREDTSKPLEAADNTSSSAPPEALVLTSQLKMQLGVLLGSSVLLQMGMGMIVPILPSYAHSIGLADTSVGLLVAVPSLARACINLPAGRLADVLGRKRPMIFGSFLDAAGNLGTAAASGLNGMVGARLVMGGGSSIAGNAAEAYMMDVVAQCPQHKGRILGAVQSAGALAWVGGPMLGGLLATSCGVTVPFLVVGGSILATIPAIQVLLPETRPPQPPPPSRTPPSAPFSGGAGGAGGLRPLELVRDAADGFRELLRDPNQQALLLMDCALYTGWSVSLAVVPLWASSVWGATPADLGKVYSLMAVLGVVGAPLGGYAADVVGRKPAVLAGGSLCALAFGSLPFLDSHAARLSAMAAVGLGESFLMSAMAAMANDVTPAQLRGTQSAMMSQVGDVTFVVMPIALTALATSTSYTTGFVCAATLIGSANVGFAALARAPRVS